MQQQDVYVPPPSLFLAFTEMHRVLGEVLSLRLSRKALLRRAPEGDGHAVMVLPGFLAGDRYNAALRRFLAELGYVVYGWGQGQNLGPRDGVLEGLEERITDIYAEHGAMSLVGHSLGGIFAREIARREPHMVRQVISLGSPFGEGRMTASIPARLFTALNPPEELPIEEELLSSAPPVPTTAIYSTGDGIVNWKTTYQANGHAQTQSVRVRGSHCGMTFNPSIWYLIAQMLALPEGQWRRFEGAANCQWVYPAALV
ncbi:MAG: lysophospholipase [Gammaproteobacteria bacterium]|jgi:pimeloyl-ACP methyl ester carboxylesterase|nr:lysophospholipase [Gammaproteobacteria bacterium]